MAVMGFAYLTSSPTIANANQPCEKVFSATSALDRFKSAQRIDDLTSLNPEFALTLGAKIKAFSEMTADQKRSFVAENWASEDYTEADIAQLFAQMTQTDIEEAFMDYVQKDLAEAYMESLTQKSASRPALRRSEPPPADQSIQRLDKIDRSDLKPNEVYNIPLSVSLSGQTELRIRLSEQAIKHLKSENENDGNLVKALGRGFAHTGMGIQPMTEAQVLLKNLPSGKLSLPVFRVKPKGISSYRWVMTRLPNGDFYIIGRFHKNNMQELELELDAKKLPFAAER